MCSVLGLLLAILFDESNPLILADPFFPCLLVD